MRLQIRVYIAYMPGDYGRNKFRPTLVRTTKGNPAISVTIDNG